MWLGSIGFTLLPLWTLILIALTSTSSSGQLASGQYCHVETVRQTRSLQLGLLVNIHRAKADGRPGCGAISPWGLQEYLAIKWILEELSRTNFIKGVPIGKWTRLYLLYLSRKPWHECSIHLRPWLSCTGNLSYLHAISEI